MSRKLECRQKILAAEVLCLCVALTQQTGLVWYWSCWGCCEQKMYDLVVRNLSFGGTSQFNSWLHHKPLACPRHAILPSCDSVYLLGNRGEEIAPYFVG